MNRRLSLLDIQLLTQGRSLCLYLDQLVLSFLELFLETEYNIVVGFDLGSLGLQRLLHLLHLGSEFSRICATTRCHTLSVQESKFS